MTDIRNLNESPTEPTNDTTLVDAVEAVGATIADPSPLNILRDLEVAAKLAQRFKASISGLHPSVIDVIKNML